jgi:uncharacterized protein
MLGGQKVKLIVIVFMALLTMPVFASELDDARKAGHIIETPDGFVKSSAKAPESAKTLVKEVNAKRRMAYQKIANKHGLTVDQVGAESYIKRMKPGPR